jgi:hypothetical protein
MDNVHSGSCAIAGGAVHDGMLTQSLLHGFLFEQLLYYSAPVLSLGVEMSRWDF